MTQHGGQALAMAALAGYSREQRTELERAYGRAVTAGRVADMTATFLGFVEGYAAAKGWL